MTFFQRKLDLVNSENQSRSSVMGSIIIAIFISEMLVVAAIIMIALFTTTASATDDMSNAQFMGGQPMNKLWLGMKVVTIDGRSVGHILDFNINADGGVETISIQPHERSALIEAKVIDATFVMLADSHVIADMTFNTLMAQISTETYLAQQNR